MSSRLALLGLSGVGKSTIIRSLQRKVPLVHLQASELIKAEQARWTRNVDNSEALRLGSVMDNQELMIAAFRREAQATSLPIIFDGHSVIDGRDGLIEVPAFVFAALGLQAICYLSAAPELIASRRRADVLRSRPIRDADTLADHQRIARQVAETIAVEISCDFVEITDEGVDKLMQLIG